MRKDALLLLELKFATSLRLHRIKGKFSDLHSVSIRISYRITITFLITEKTIVPIDVGSHDEVC